MKAHTMQRDVRFKPLIALAALRMPPLDSIRPSPQVRSSSRGRGRVVVLGAEGATAPETLRQKDRERQ